MANNVLIAVELDEHSAHTVLGKALKLLGPNDHPHIVHVVDPKYVRYSTGPSFKGRIYDELAEAAVQQAKQQLTTLCNDFDVDPAKQHILYGHVAQELHNYAIDNSCTALMLGSHGYSGWRRVLGSQAASVLHGTPIDTWVIYIPPSKRRTDN